MLIRPKILLLLVSLLLVVMLSGCSDDTANPTGSSLTASDDYSQMDFSLPYGGLTVSDENEAFDDESLKALLLAEEEDVVDDPLALDPDVLALEEEGAEPSGPNNGNRPRFTYLRLRWGMIHGPDDASEIPEDGCEPLDWTGELHTDRGMVVVRRAIAFERPLDHVIFPRLNRQTVAFVSHTGCHYDGLVIQIIERPADRSDENPEPNRLHINTGPFAGVYDVNDLTALDEMIDVDALGNRIQLTGFTLSDISACPKGFLSGRFRTLPMDEETESLTLEEDPEGVPLGRIAGVWMSLHGRINGFIRGGYGLNPEGERVFFGKYISRRGEFRGLLAGTWEPGETDDDLATFQGHWVNAAGTVDGVLGGDAHLVADYPGGFFTGRWATQCDDEAEAEVQ